MIKFLRRHFFSIVVLFFLVGYYIVMTTTTAGKISEMKKQGDALRTEIAQKQQDLARVKDYYELSQTPEFVEKIAREKLKMVKPNEIIYYILRDGNPSANTGTEAPKTPEIGNPEGGGTE